jgi:hypothetical protein
VRLNEGDELRQGIADGLDPQVADPVNADGTAVTGAPSWWFHTRCRTCGHTFRRGDRVRVDRATRNVVHLEPGLGCAGGPATEEVRETAEFTEGLLSEWPADRPVTMLGPDDWRLPLPGARSAPGCLYCGHTFREGEHVVICPCRLGSPACGAAVHRDPARGLPCWERWKPEGDVPVCPTLKARADDGS